MQQAVVVAGPPIDLVPAGALATVKRDDLFVAARELDREVPRAVFLAKEVNDRLVIELILTLVIQRGVEELAQVCNDIINVLLSESGEVGELGDGHFRARGG